LRAYSVDTTLRWLVTWGQALIVLVRILLVVVAAITGSGALHAQGAAPKPGLESVTTPTEQRALDAIAAFRHSQTYAELLPAAQAGDVEAQYGLGFLLMVIETMLERAPTYAIPEAERAAVWYRRAADAEHGRAEFRLGQLLAKGKLLPKDDQAAVKFYRRAAERGVPEARTNLAGMYMRGDGVRRDRYIAEGWLRLGMIGGDRLGSETWVHLQGTRLLGPRMRLWQTFHEARERNDRATIQRIAEEHQGSDNPLLQKLVANAREALGDAAGAAAAWRRAALLGDLYAQQHVLQAMCGDCANPSTEALTFMRAQASAGTNEVKWALLHLDGKLGPANKLAASAWLKRANYKGAAAHATLVNALLPLKRERVEEERLSAARWRIKVIEGDLKIEIYVPQPVYLESIANYWDDDLQRTAEEGDPLAQQWLGFRIGAIDQGSAEAARWHRKAADQGFAEAQICLADLHLLGWGVTLDRVEALKWATLAAAQGEWHGMRRREQLLSKLSAEEIARAERAVEDWRPTYE